MAHTDGTTATVVREPDPRWGLIAPVVASLTTETAGGLQNIVTQSRALVLDDDSDLFSVVTLTETVDVNGRITTVEYDGTTRQLTTTTPAGHQRVTLLDDRGRITSLRSSRWVEPQDYTYDGQGRLETVVHGDQSLTLGYDALHRIISRENAAAHVTGLGHDDAGRITAFTRPDAEVVAFGYDLNGNRNVVTMPAGQVHTQSHSPLDQPAGYTPPGSAAFSTDYDLDRGLLRRTLPSGREVLNAFDDDHIWSGITYPAATINFSYDGLGDRVLQHERVATTIGADQTVAYTYDGPLVTSATFTGAADGAFAYTYDDNFHLVSIDLVSGADSATDVIARNLDGDIVGTGPFTFVRDGLGGALGQITDGTLAQDYATDDVGRFGAKTLSVGGSPVFATSVTYNNAGRIAARTVTIGGTPFDEVYTYDVVGRLQHVTRGGAQTELYGYDANGNRDSTLAGAATYDDQDRVTSVAGTGYTFDVDGFLAARGADTFVYSAKGELLRATVAGNNIDYSYDGLHRRVARTDASGTTEYLYGDPGHPFLVTASRRGGVLTRYFHDLRGALYAFVRGGNTYYVGADQVGTPWVVVDDTGAVVKQLDYDSTGRRLADSAPAFDLAIGFAGGLEDVATGLTRFGYRDYDAASGRWTARDPILYGGGQANLYTYVGNDPVGLRDPLGLFCLGASAYEIVGGGAEVCYDWDKGVASVCTEFGAGLGNEIAINDGTPKYDEEIAEFGANAECGPAKLGFKCKKSTRCGKLGCTPVAGFDSYEVDGSGESKLGKEILKDKNTGSKCGIKGVAKVQSCLRIP